MLFSIVIYKIAYDLKFYKTTPFYLHFVNILFYQHTENGVTAYIMSVL